MRRTFRFVFFGDSICVGQGVAMHRTWTSRLSARLAEAIEPLGWTLDVANASVNGDTTRMALERMAFDVQNAGVDAILIQFGLNDANCWQTDRGLPRVSEAAFAANLKEMIVRARTFGAKAVLLNTNHPSARDQAPMPPTDTTYRAATRRYNEVVRDVARAAPGAVTLNDLESHFAATTGGDDARLQPLLLADGLHLSESGHDAYFAFLEASVVSAARAAAAPNGR